jgi:hypothetical protein
LLPHMQDLWGEIEVHQHGGSGVLLRPYVRAPEGGQHDSDENNDAAWRPGVLPPQCNVNCSGLQS